MSRKPETRSFKVGFIPAELKKTDSRGRTTESSTQRQGSSDGEESLSDPRCHKRLPAKEKKGKFKQGHTKIAKSGHFQGTRRERSDRTKENGRNQEKINLPQNIFPRQTNNTNKHDRPQERHRSFRNKIKPDENSNNLNSHTNEIHWD